MLGGGAEDVGVDELPAELLALFGLLLISRHGIVPHQIPLQVPDQDGRHHAREHDGDEKGVEDLVPVDGGGDAALHGEVNVPPRGPVDVGLGPDHVVREEDDPGSLLGPDGRVDSHVPGGVGVRGVGVAGRQDVRVRHYDGVKALPRVPLDVPLPGLEVELVVDAERLHDEPHHAVFVRLALDLVVVDVDVDVVVHVLGSGLGVDEANGKAVVQVQGLDDFRVLHHHRRRNVVDNPIVMVRVLDEAWHPPLLTPPKVARAQLHAVRVRLHLQYVGGVLDVVAGEPLAEVLRISDDVYFAGLIMRLAEGELISLLPLHGLCGRQGVDLQGHCFPRAKVTRVHTGKVEAICGREEEE
mmetsp:Transcript_13143/g.26994  ORF Transcript_13143/g.26994 Transcript_13143/m.26994 type:complete len:355 (-) Transcript_13143:192-1256(-)